MPREIRTKILYVCIIVLQSICLAKAYCYNDCFNNAPNSWCCSNQECCTFNEYTGNTFADDDVRSSVETGGKIAVGIIIAIVVACIVGIVACIIGCVYCCCRNTNRPGQVLTRPGVVTTTTLHSGQPGVPVHPHQQGYHPGQPKAQYPAGPAPPYVPPGQPMAPPPYTQPGYQPVQGAPPPAGYQPMPTAMPTGAAPYPAAPGGTPYPAAPGGTPYPAAPGGTPYPGAQPAYAPQPGMQPQHPYPTKDSAQASAPPY